jgi:hypothetical protein
MWRVTSRWILGYWVAAGLLGIRYNVLGNTSGKMNLPNLLFTTIGYLPMKQKDANAVSEALSTKMGIFPVGIVYIWRSPDDRSMTLKMCFYQRVCCFSLLFAFRTLRYYVPKRHFSYLLNIMTKIAILSGRSHNEYPVTCLSVCRNDLDLWSDLLTTSSHDSLLHVTITLSPISTLYKSLRSRSVWFH